MATWNTKIWQNGNMERELNEISYVSMNEIKLAKDCAKNGLLYHGQYGDRVFLCFFLCHVR